MIFQYAPIISAIASSVTAVIAVALYRAKRIPIITCDVVSEEFLANLRIRNDGERTAFNVKIIHKGTLVDNDGKPVNMPAMNFTSIAPGEEIIYNIGSHINWSSSDKSEFYSFQPVWSRSLGGWRYFGHEHVFYPHEVAASSVIPNYVRKSANALVDIEKHIKSIRNIVDKSYQIYRNQSVSPNRKLSASQRVRIKLLSNRKTTGV